MRSCSICCKRWGVLPLFAYIGLTEETLFPISVADETINKLDGVGDCGLITPAKFQNSFD